MIQMSSPFQSKSFKDLRAKWAAKLKKSGFEDLEDENGLLKHIGHADYFSINFNAISAQAKEEYYRKAGYFLYDHKFKTELERKIWELHADGVSIRDIVKILKTKGKKIYKSKVENLLRPLVEKCLHGKERPDND